MEIKLRNCSYLVCAAILVLAVARIVVADRTRAQGFDEPAHIAAGMEWLQFHSYRLDPLHPPLARLAIAAPLYVSGERFQQADSSALPNFWEAGNSILYRENNYLRNLSFARFGVLPFLLILLVATFLWTKRRAGSVTACLALVLISTLPVVLSFASLAYTDLPAACLQVVCIFAFAAWLETPGFASSAGLGLLFGLAVLTKFTSVIYIPVAMLGILLCRAWFRAERPNWSLTLRSMLGVKLALIATLTVMTVWAGYRFSVANLTDSLGVSKTAIPTFQHFPYPARGLAKTIFESDWRVPAPAFFAGLADVWVLNKSAPEAYLFGKFKPGGWWYFFLVETFFKTPLPFLILTIAAFPALHRKFLEKDWMSLVPAIAVLSIALCTATASLNAGLRHVLIVFPLLAIIASYGATELWKLPSKLHVGKVLVVCLIAWQSLTVLRPGIDWIAYFNELAGHDPSKILVTGCDLDCGQDVLHLSRELQRRNISQASIGLWSSADLQRMGLPQFRVLAPFQPETGWIAISLRAIREGSVQHKTYPPASFSWLGQYRPVAQVGSTIWLYCIPAIGVADVCNR